MGGNFNATDGAHRFRAWCALKFIEASFAEPVSVAGAGDGTTPGQPPIDFGCSDRVCSFHEGPYAALEEHDLGLR